MILGITGGTGSGKSTLLRLIAARGGKVLDCDAIYHRLLETDTKLLSAIEDRFPGVVNHGVLDRKKLGGIVFADKNALQDLNRITHDAVKQEVLRQLVSQHSLVAIDAIGLFEGELDVLCDVTVAITAPVELRIQRIMNRDNLSEDYARSRIEAQHEDAWFAEKCDALLENNGTQEEFTAKCLAFLSKLGIIKENAKGE